MINNHQNKNIIILNDFRVANIVKYGKISIVSYLDACVVNNCAKISLTIVNKKYIEKWPKFKI